MGAQGGVQKVGTKREPVAQGESRNKSSQSGRGGTRSEAAGCIQTKQCNKIHEKREEIVPKCLTDKTQTEDRMAGNWQKARIKEWRSKGGQKRVSEIELVKTFMGVCKRLGW